MAVTFKSEALQHILMIANLNISSENAKCGRVNTTKHL